MGSRVASKSASRASGVCATTGKWEERGWNGWPWNGGGGTGVLGMAGVERVACGRRANVRWRLGESD